MRYGVILFSDPVIGSSPANVYIKNNSSEGLSTFTGNPNQFGYSIELVPEPGTFALAGLGLGMLFIFRRRQ